MTPPRLIPDYLQSAAQERPEAEALVFGERRLSYREYAGQVDRVARALLAQDIQPGDRVAILLPNWPEFAFAAIACISVGAIAVMLNIRLSAEEIDYQLRDSGAKLLLAAKDFKGRDFAADLSRWRSSCPALEQMVVLGELPQALAWEDFLARGGGADDALRLRRQSCGEDQTAVLIYTSGTTGRPKGVMFRHGNLVRNIQAYIQATGQSLSDRRLTVVPMYHTSGAVAFLASAFVGGTVVLMDDFSVQPVLDCIKAEGITILGGPPTVLVLLLRSVGLEASDLETLRMYVSFGAPIQPELVRAARALRLEVLNVYGMTEMGVATMTRFGDAPELLEESVGRPIPAVELRIVGERRRGVSSGAVGELAVRSATMMQGYWNQPEATAAVLDAEGWFYTGDMAWRDEEGVLRVMGRRDDMYIRGGVNVYPKVVEDALARHPGVLMAAVIGLPDEIMGQVGHALVVPRPGQSLDASQLLDFLRGKVADYELPLSLELRGSLPMNATRKILKRQLVAQVLGERGQAKKGKREP